MNSRPSRHVRVPNTDFTCVKCHCVYDPQIVYAPILQAYILPITLLYCDHCLSTSLMARLQNKLN